MIGCNVNAITQIISGVVIGKEPQNRFPSLCGHSYLFTGIYISALSKRHEKLRPPMFAAPVGCGCVCAPVGIVNKREGIQNPTLTAKAGQAYPKKVSINELIIWKNESVSRSHNWCQI